nr:MAG TPA: hypothetical protein [Caudoviricetes sp.]
MENKAGTFLSVLGTILIILKLLGVLNISWWWVLLPYGILIFAPVLLIILMYFTIIVGIFIGKEK